MAKSSKPIKKAKSIDIEEAKEMLVEYLTEINSPEELAELYLNELSNKVIKEMAKEYKEYAGGDDEEEDEE